MIRSQLERTMAFFLVCIPVRMLAAWWSYKYPRSKSSAVLAVGYGVAGATMIYFFLTNSRLAAREAGGNTWWNGVRPLFGALYLLFAIYTAKGYRQSYKFLVAEIILGLVVWYSHSQCPSVQFTPTGESQLVHEAHKAQYRNLSNPVTQITSEGRRRAVMFVTPVIIIIALIFVHLEK